MPTTFSVCLFASEVAAMIGKNPYRHPVEILMTLWKKHDRGKSFEQAQARVAKRDRVQVDTINDTESVIAAAVEQNAKLKTILQTYERQVKEKALPTVLKDAEKEIKTLLTQQRLECVENPALKQTAVGTLLGVNDRSSVQVTEAEVTRHIQSTLSKTYGHQREKQTLESHPEIKQNNDKFYCKYLGRVVDSGLDCRYQLGGKVDGLRQNRLVEIKNR